MEQPRMPAGQPIPYDHEVWFGDYRDDRFAWEILQAKKFEQLITGVKGKLNL